ncbi:MAG: hypothetical protein U0457_20975 [Candidatus Sericytochromatia bacterium]
MSVKFSDPSLTRLFDLNNDGKVTKKEVKEVLKADGNKKDLSVQDLQKAGYSDPTEQQALITAYKEHKAQTNIFSFPDLFKQQKPDQNSDKTPENNLNLGNLFGIKQNNTNIPPSNGNWKHDLIEKYQNTPNTVDRENEIKKGVSSFNKNDLLKSTKNDPNVAELLKILGNDKKAGVYISELFKKHPDKASDICKSLVEYSNRPSSPEALINNENKKEYIKSILHDVAYPTDIHQQQEGTCTATSTQVKLAKEDPKKYVELATTLADGKNWKKIEPNRFLDLQKNSSDTRSLTEKIVQNSFMDFGNGTPDWGSKAIASDENKERGNKDKMESAGLESNREVKSLLKELFGNSNPVTKDRNNPEKAFKLIDESLAKGNSVPFSAVLSDPTTGEPIKDEKGNYKEGHEMLILSKNPEDNTYTIFSWGKEIKVSPEDLKRHLYDAQIAYPN